MRLITLLTVLFAMLLASIIIAADFGLVRPIFVALRSIPMADKVAHFLLFGIMSLLLNLTLNGERVRLVSACLLKGTLVLLLIATVEEMSNLVQPRRTFSLMDLACNYLGIVLFGQLAVLILARLRLRREVAPQAI